MEDSSQNYYSVSTPWLHKVVYNNEDGTTSTMFINKDEICILYVCDENPNVAILETFTRGNFELSKTNNPVFAFLWSW
jgi:hypothetical protein